MEQLLFYTKCRPQSADAWPIARDHLRVFVGYPVYRTNGGPTTGWRQVGVHALLADVSAPDFDRVGKVQMSRGHRSQVTRNRNLARRIDVGSIVLVPRVDRGICYAGELSGRFELADRPGWADDYIELRKAQGLAAAPEFDHVGDVVQCWPVQEWHELPFPALPRWISYRLLSRNTTDVIADLDDPKRSALNTVRSLMELPKHQRYAVVQGSSSVEEALLSWVSPSSFEHLVVDLLQLEQLGEGGKVDWHHVGGSGDGGVDGIGVGIDGRLVGVVQCKWHHDGSAADLAAQIRKGVAQEVRVVIAVLHGRCESPSSTATFELWDRGRVAELVRQNAAHLPRAQAFAAAQPAASAAGRAKD